MKCEVQQLPSPETAAPRAPTRQLRESRYFGVDFLLIFSRVLLLSISLFGFNHCEMLLHGHIRWVGRGRSHNGDASGRAWEQDIRVLLVPTSAPRHHRREETQKSIILQENQSIPTT